MATLQRISPCLWFNKQAEQAVNFYVDIFERSKITAVTHYSEEGQEIHGMPAGSVMTLAFELDGQSLTALNGGSQFKFSEAISLQVFCDTQQEVDYYWERLRHGGDERAQICGWLKDQFGLSWQVVPRVLPQLVAQADPVKSRRVMAALLQMKKLDIARLQEASNS